MVHHGRHQDLLTFCKPLLNSSFDFIYTLIWPPTGSVYVLMTCLYLNEQTMYKFRRWFPKITIVKLIWFIKMWQADSMTIYILPYFFQFIYTILCIYVYMYYLWNSPLCVASFELKFWMLLLKSLCFTVSNVCSGLLICYTARLSPTSAPANATRQPYLTVIYLSNFNSIHGKKHKYEEIRSDFHDQTLGNNVEVGPWRYFNLTSMWL